MLRLIQAEFLKLRRKKFIVLMLLSALFMPLLAVFYFRSADNLQVSDIPKTSLVLERQFGVTEYSVQDEHTLRIYDTSLDMAAVNKALVVQDIAVISSQLCNDTLEDYFKKITGGEGIA